MFELIKLKEARKDKDNETYISYLIYLITKCMNEFSRTTSYDESIDEEFVFRALNKISSEYKIEAQLDEEQYISHLESIYFAFEVLISEIFD